MILWLLEPIKVMWQWQWERKTIEKILTLLSDENTYETVKKEVLLTFFLENWKSYSPDGKKRVYFATDLQ